MIIIKIDNVNKIASKLCIYHYQELYLKNIRVYNFESDLILDVDSQSNLMPYANYLMPIVFLFSNEHTEK